jgi:hypothetical protein
MQDPVASDPTAVYRLFVFYNHPLPQLDSECRTVQIPYDFIYNIDLARSYSGFVSEKGNLILCSDTMVRPFIRQPDGSFVQAEPVYNPSIEFTPQDVDQLFNGIFYHTANPNSVVRPKELVDIIKYRYSDQFKADQAKQQR